MLEQIAFSRTPAFERFMRGLDATGDGHALIHGIFIDFHPTWKAMTDIESATSIGGGEIWHDWPGSYIHTNSQPEHHHGIYNETYHSASWDRICRRSQKENSPFVVIIYVIPVARDGLTLRQSVERYAQAQPFFTIVVDAPLASFTANVTGGSGITAAQTGTVGGFLRDASNNIWGVTCGHVASSLNGNVDLEDSSGATVSAAGQVRHTNFHQFQTLSSGSPCNSYIQNSQNIDTDAALFELDAAHTGLSRIKSLGNVDLIYDRTNLGSGAIVSMCGAVSGQRDYEIGAFGVTCKIKEKITGNQFCFSDVFEFSAQSQGPQWIPNRLLQAVSHRPLSGDSGSWVCFNHTGSQYAYFGNLIAIRGAVGIATFADSLINWAKSSPINLDLSPL